MICFKNLFSLGLLLLFGVACRSQPFGSPSLPQVSITDDGQYRYIRSNGIPGHETGAFPNPGNPHAIESQRHNYRMPMQPKLAGRTTELGLSPFGVALNGVPFDPGAAEFWQCDRDSGWQFEALSGVIPLGLDKHNAHVQPSGAYHYHGLPTALLANQASDRHSQIIGYAADGFPVYARYGHADSQETIRELRSSYRIKEGERSGGPGGSYDGTFVQDYEFIAGLGDLDECNGRETKTPDYPDGTYAYFLTKTYPVIPRCLKGTPDKSFLRRGPPPGGLFDKRRGGPCSQYKPAAAASRR